jgi:hypothetical protein
VAFDRNAGGHTFDFDTRACTICGMTQEEFRDKNQPACPGKIFADPGQFATLVHGGKSVRATLQEVVLAWMRLSKEDRAQATIRTDSGTVYNASEIDRLHIAAGTGTDSGG